MNCPACSNQLTQTSVASVTLDICKDGCGGLWFDNFELKKFDEPSESAGQALLDTPRDESLVIDYSAKRLCPKCNIPMMRHFSSIKRQVTIDECPACAGVWLDAGELKTIRSLFKTEQEKSDATDKYISEIAQTHLPKIADSAKAQKFANMFRFICPSNYIPGKQSWGAF